MQPTHLEPISSRAEAADPQQSAVDAILNGARKLAKLRAQGWVANVLYYVCAFDSAGTIIVMSDGTVLPRLPDNFYLPSPPPDCSPMTPEGVRRLRGHATVSGPDLFRELRDYFKKHAIFTHPSTPAVLALWSIATYLHALFNYFGYLWFTSLGPSHGKSLVEEMLELICFNATPPQTTPTPATIFRQVDANSNTLILDEIEGLDPSKKSEVLALLNIGFKRGGQVPRSEHVRGGWRIQRFDVYSPKVIAGITHLPAALGTRVIRIDMPNRKEGEPIEYFEAHRLADWAAKMRDDQAIFALTNAQRIANIYSSRDHCVPTTMSDRQRDIFAPLYAVAAAIDQEAGQPLATPALTEFIEETEASLAADGPADYVFALHALRTRLESRWQHGKALIKTAEAIEVFRAAEIEGVTGPAPVKALLRKLGGKNRAIWWSGETQRGYVFDRDQLKELIERNPMPISIDPASSATGAA